MALSTLEYGRRGHSARRRRHAARHLSHSWSSRSAGPGIAYDKQGEDFYNLISAFIKSLRNSDANAALYWLARMIEGGADPMFIARRLCILASEDVGLADPQAIVQAAAAAQITHLIGLPEALFPLAQATIYLARAPKSNLVKSGLSRRGRRCRRLRPRAGAAPPAQRRHRAHEGRRLRPGLPLRPRRPRRRARCPACPSGSRAATIFVKARLRRNPTPISQHAVIHSPIGPAE